MRVALDAAPNVPRRPLMGRLHATVLSLLLACCASLATPKEQGYLPACGPTVLRMAASPARYTWPPSNPAPGIPAVVPPNSDATGQNPPAPTSQNAVSAMEPPPVTLAAGATVEGPPPPPPPPQIPASELLVVTPEMVADYFRSNIATQPMAPPMVPAYLPFVPPVQFPTHSSEAVYQLQ